VTPGSAEELSRALERLISDPALAAELGGQGQKQVEERFSWPKVVARVEEAYDAARRRAAPDHLSQARGT
jgi:glycosyltransferase involved in cell wall biosynthesis